MFNYFIQGAKADLDKALELSAEKGTPACQAFTQRGLIRKKEGETGLKSASRYNKKGSLW